MPTVARRQASILYRALRGLLLVSPLMAASCGEEESRGPSTPASPIAENGGTTPPTGEAARQAELVEAARSLFMVLGSDLPEEYRVDMDDLCSTHPCPKLEDVLASDSCSSIAVGCGLVEVKPDANTYWYEGFGTAPVGVSLVGQADGQGPWAATQSVACESLVTVCSTCGRASVSYCEDDPDALPEPPAPEPVPGCVCEPDAAGGDPHVSLDCFCSIYSCPTYAEFVLECEPSDEAGLSPAQATLGCGEVWFATAARSGQRFAYDFTSHELVAAVAFSSGPVTQPCGSYRVSAGASRECDSQQACRCNGLNSAYLVAPGRGEIADACEDVDWFREL